MTNLSALARPRISSVAKSTPPHFMFRVAPLPWERLQGLAFSRTVAWADVVLDAEARLDDAARTLPDRVQEFIGGQEDDGVRHALINLRRDIFNARVPRDIEATRAALAILPDGLAGDILEWIDLAQQTRDVRRSGADVFRAELPLRRAALQRLIATPVLRSGILLASPSLDEAIPRYLAADPASLSKRARRIERSASDYVYRTVCKTSPFSTLTDVALGDFSGDAGGVLEVDPEVLDSQAARSNPRLNMAMLARVSEAILASDEHLVDLPVMVSRGWTSDRRRVRYMRRQRKVGDADAAMTLDTFDENVFFLAHSDIVDDLFRVLGDRMMTMGRLQIALHSQLPHDRPLDDVWHYLRHLLRLNLLTAPVLTMDIHAADPAVHFADRIAGLEAPWASTLSSDIRRMTDLVGTYAQASVDERRLIIRDLHSHYDAMMRGIGVQQPERLRTVVYEDSALPRGSVRASLDAWESGLSGDFASLARILPVFDSLTPHRLMVRGFFDARYGARGTCDDIVKFTHDFHLDVYDQYLRYSANRRPFVDNEYQDQENWFKMDEVRALDEARRTLVRAMRSRYAAHDGAGDLVLDDAFVEEVAAALPDLGDRLDPRAYFGQIGEIDGRDRCVLNRTYTGLSLLFSRFHHCFAESGDTSLVDALREHLRSITPPGAVFAEITGGYDTSNLNLHSVVTPYEIVCPGEVSFRDTDEQLPVEDLSIVRDPSCGRLLLRSRRLDVEVIPVYLGFLMPMALPEMQRLLLAFSQSRIASLDLWTGTDEPLGGGEIGGHPRVRLGDLVLVRRVWKTDPASLPEGLLGADGAERMLGWRRWTRRHGLPRYVFVTPDAAGGDEGEGDDSAVRFGKPQFVDFEDHFCLDILDQLAQRANRRLVFTEMLPVPESLPARNAAGERFVSEITFEFNAPAVTR
ncbi:lantibiotic dehydratase [Microbacterium sp. NPDC006705]|uniref:lantibiotic dehydratase n=1 Tax=Microbacterium TaxID=33882 RepID=UPI00249DC813|nr:MULTISPECIES: lantibiotic dehydratase [Microbacterium]WHE36164.1 lantibiotic dehydratase [Microbacterium sp. BDGP8]WRK17447.1 lantibiotic dehydratase [Microbacterium plantarum]